MMENILQNFFMLVLVLCIVPGVVLVILAAVALRFGQQFLERVASPDADKLYERYTALYSADPNRNTERLVQRMVHEQALKAGLVGAITGLGGFITLPVTLPIDMLLSARLQTATVYFIARVYGFNPEANDAKLAGYLVMARGGAVAEASSRTLMNFVVRVLGKSFSKLIPLVGAIISFVVNYFFAQVTARAAMHWYAQRQKQRVITP